jgi:hypothetical protein
MDLDSGADRDQAAAIADGMLRGVELTARDTALVITR